MEFNETVIDGKRYLEIDYPVGRLCWYRNEKGYKQCGHVCGFICEDFKNMIFKYCVENVSKVDIVDKVYETEKELG